MKLKATAIGVALAMVALCGGTMAVSQEGEKPPDDKAAMWAAVEEMSAPGEHHGHLKPLAGNWKFTTKFRMAPDAPWDTSEGTAEHRWAMGGRFLMQEVKGQIGEQKFEGFGIIGYNKIRKRYVSVWIDNMNTAVMVDHGTCDASGKVFTFEGTNDDPMTGQPKKFRTVMRIINSDKYLLEMHDLGPGNDPFLSMQITYTRG